MNDVKKRARWLSLLGFALGAGVGLMFYFLAGSEAILAQADQLPARALYFLLCGSYGAANMGTSALYGIDEWSILRCTATHFLIVVGDTILFFGALILLGWMAMPPAGVCALIAAAYTLVYFLIWLAQYLSYKRKVKSMNAKLRSWKSQQKT
ncbi:MAG: DUF3021 domain-containing protein [Clostridia bacterium]|nr:DUF3021 domain-containing protein [Clostridia bacterium]